MSNETNDKCPHCGTDIYTAFTKQTIHEVDLCKARKVNAELAKTKEFADSRIHLANDLTRQNLALMERLEKVEAENAKLRETNQEDLAKLTEAVQLGTKQAEEFDKIYDKLRKLLEVAIEVAEDALEERDLKRRIADEIGSLKAELNRLPKS